MRLAVDLEQQKFFRKNHHLTLLDLFSREVSDPLRHKIANVLDESPHYTQNDLFRSIPTLIPLIHKLQIGEVAAQLIDKRPLWLKSDCYITTSPSAFLEEQEIGVLLSFETGDAHFFMGELPSIYNSSEACYLLFVFSAYQTAHPKIVS